MPNISERQRLLSNIDQSMQLAAMDQIIRGESDESDFEDRAGGRSEDEDDDMTTWETLCMLHLMVSSNRFLHHRIDLGRSKDYILNYFHNQSDADFRKITRVSRETFGLILGLIQNHPTFQNDSNCQQLPVHWQLACALDRLGNDGQGISHARNKLIWGIGQGTVHLFTRRVMAALFALRDRFIMWPCVAERASISKRMELKGFKNVVGFVDGTVFSLHRKQALHNNIFMDWKKKYSVNAQIVCDNLRRVIFFQTRHPRSCADARVFSSSVLQQMPDEAFSPGQFLLSDLGYGASTTIVPAYRENQHDCLGDRNEPRKIERFNTFLAKARVVNEHTIGVMKARWTSLKGMRIDLNEEDHMVRIVKQATACVVLHNTSLQSDPWDEEDEVEEEADHEAIPAEYQQRRVLTLGQRKRWEVRRACLAFHDRE